MNLVSTMLAIVSLCFNGNKYWEDFSDSEKDRVLKTENVPEEVIKLYNAQFILSDDEATFGLIGKLISEQTNVGLKALYFHLFNKIILSADGALAEVMADYAIIVFMSDIRYVLDYFTIYNEIMVRYGESLGVEFYFNQDGKSGFPYTFNQFKEKIKMDLNDSNKYDKLLSCFYEIIDHQMKRMN